MESARPMSERLEWRKSYYGSGDGIDVLFLDRRDVGEVTPVPAGWAHRNYKLKFEQPGGHSIHATREEAMRSAEAWFLGLDIEPWDEP